MSKSIDKKDEALKLALEALEHGLVNTNPVLNYDGRIISKAITAIKKALAHAPSEREQPAQEEIQRLSALVRAQQITIEKLEAQSESK